MNASGIEYVVVGGLAAGYQGEPRVTEDADVVAFLPADDLERLIAHARRRGVRCSPAAIRRGAAEDAFFRFAVAGVQVDFMVGQSAFEFEVLARRRPVSLFGVRVPMASPEDVILMKLVAGRDQDWPDAKAILVRHGARLDGRYLEGWSRSLKVQRGRGNAFRRLSLLRRMAYRDRLPKG